MAKKTYDLRSALELLKTIPGQFAETDVETDPILEMAAVERYVCGVGTSMRPTRRGPVLQFNNVKGFPGVRTVMGVLASRERIGYMLDVPEKELGHWLYERVKEPIDPVIVDKGVCQEVVHYATDPDFDVRKIIPVTQFTPDDGGPCITMGIVRAHDRDTGNCDVTYHRIFLQDAPDEITITTQTGGNRHIGAMLEKARAAGESLPVTINIGCDPAVSIGTCFAPPTTPYGFDELSIAGSMRGEPVQLCKAITVNETAIANSEWVIEGEILPDRMGREDVYGQNGGSIPEFPGYIGKNYTSPICKIKAITHRKNPIYQCLIGPSEEHVNIAGIPLEACVWEVAENGMEGVLKNVYANGSGGGKMSIVMQINRKQHDGDERNLAIMAFSVFRDLKHVFLVDEDVDPFDPTDLLWALNFRFAGNKDVLALPGLWCHPSDPSEGPAYCKDFSAPGVGCKTIFDLTVPAGRYDDFKRGQFIDVDPKKFFPDVF